MLDDHDVNKEVEPAASVSTLENSTAQRVGTIKDRSQDRWVSC